ncbi:MAG: AraC family transcriptional regulator [Oceanospirillaceae bacterium]|nr:AraC family transcriptional regulator [Oceanospirillaceae bacterium]
MTLERREGTVIGGWTVAIARAMDHYGLDTEAIFKACRINLSQALDSNARFPVVPISQVLQAAADASGDANFGLMVAKYIRPTSWHALGISIWASACMKESFERLVRYQRMFNTAIEIQMVQGDSSTEVSMRFKDAYAPVLGDIDMDAIMATALLTCRHVAEGQFRPLGVTLCRPSPVNPEGFERLFRCPVEFASDSNRILMKNDDLERPLPTRNAELAMLNDRLIQEYLTRLDRHDIVNQVYLKLMETLGNGIPDQQQVARSLHLSQRNMQRKLQLAGTSYQEILDQLRQELAPQYLQQSHLSINEISYRLGFSRVGSFTRAFKRWSGHSPNQYRDTISSSRESEH